MTGLDFLPYADRELQRFPELRDQVEVLIARECEKRRGAEPFDVEKVLEAQGFGTSRNEPLQDPAASTKGNAFLQAELQRVLKEGPASPDPIVQDPRYQPVQCPGDDASSEAWEKAIQHNALVLERLDNELMDVELQAEFGPSAWKVYAQTMEGLTERATARLRHTQDETTAINQARKGAHLVAGEKERKLRNKWVDHINQVKLIRRALAESSLSTKDAKETRASGATSALSEALGAATDDRGEDCGPEPKRRKT